MRPAHASARPAAPRGVAASLLALVAALFGSVYALLRRLRQFPDLPHATLRARCVVFALQVIFASVRSVVQLRVVCAVLTLPRALLLRVFARLDGMRYKSVTIDVVPSRLELTLSCDSDNYERPRRTLSAEWVMTSASWAEGMRSNVALFIHGGFFVALDSMTYRPLTRRLAKLGFSVLSVNYRRAPENEFPDALHDCCATYLWLVKDIGVPAEHIMLIGDGAGGNLALGMLSALDERGSPLPGGLCLLSPNLDLDPYLPSITRNERYDYLSILQNKHVNAVAQYAGSRYDGDLPVFLAQPLIDLCRERPSVPLLIQSSSMSQLADGIERFLAAQRTPKSSIEHDILLGTPHSPHFLAEHLQLTHSEEVMRIAYARIWEWWRTVRKNTTPGIRKHMISAGGSVRSVEINTRKNK